MIIYTLFDEYDFSGKTIYPFNTHMGSRDGGTYAQIANALPKAKVKEGIPFEMSEAERGAKEKISAWLKKNNLI